MRGVLNSMTNKKKPSWFGITADQTMTKYSIQLPLKK